MTFFKAAEPKSSEIKFRITPADKERIHDLARRENLSVGEFLTKLALHRAISSKTDMHNVLEIRALIHLMREIYHRDSVPSDKRLQPVLDEAVAALRRIIGRPHQLK